MVKHRLTTRATVTVLLVLCFSIGPASAAVDIKPGSCLNLVNVKNKGIIPIAVLGGEEFTVEQNVPPEKVTFSLTATQADGTNSEPVEWIPNFKAGYDDVTGPPTDCAIEEPDGSLDLLLKVRTQDLVKALTEAKVKLYNGQKVTLAVTVDDALQGENTLTLHGVKKPKRPGKK